MSSYFIGTQDYYTYKRGVVVAVHNRTRMPQLKYEGINVKTGSETNVAFKKTFYSKLPNPYSSCRKDIDTVLTSDSTFFKHTASITRYSQRLCYEICLQNLYIIPNCGCADPSILNPQPMMLITHIAAIKLPLAVWKLKEISLILCQSRIHVIVIVH